jgi:hypothetical protein
LVATEDSEETDQFFPKKMWKFGPFQLGFSQFRMIREDPRSDHCEFPPHLLSIGSHGFSVEATPSVRRIFVIFTNTSNDIGSHFGKPPSLEKKVGSYIDEYCGDGCIETVDLLIRGKGVLSIWFALMPD